MKCMRCGFELRIGTEQVGIDRNNIPEYHRFGYCDNCRTKYDLDISNQPPKRKDSVLSIWAAVLSLVSCTTVIGAIFGIVDLCKNKNDGKKHAGSWFAIVVCCVWFFIGIISIGNENSENAPTSTETEVQTEVQANSTEVAETTDIVTENNNTLSVGETFEKNGLKVTLVDYNDNYTEHSQYFEPKDGFKYIEVSFTYENTDDSEKYVSIYDCDCYADNTLCDQSYIGEEDFINANISKGRNVSFKVYYEVPVEANSIELEYNSDSFWSTENDVVFKLK